MDAIPQQFIYRLLLLLTYSAFLYFPSRSQVNNVYAYPSLAEKIYLQLDNKVYTNDNTVWFKAIVTDAIDHVPTGLSGVLYVELIGSTEKIIEQKRIKIDKGIGEGFFQLNPQYPEGWYLVRAYTEWNKNFEPGFFFTEYIQVFTAAPGAKAAAIRNITLLEGKDNQRRLNARLDPFAIDSLHSKELSLVISLDDKKDTIAIKKNGNNQYLLDYALPDACQLVTLQVQTKNQFSYVTTVVLDTNYIDLKFFPESGELVKGLPALVAFKVLDFKGVGREVVGEIMNEQGAVIASFMSNAQGMGTVSLAVMDSSAKLFARLRSPGVQDTKKLYPLPVVAAKGNVLSVKKEGDRVRLKAWSNYLHQDSITIRATCRGIVHFDFKGALKNGLLEFALPSNQLPEGIIGFTMLLDSTSAVAERLYFNQQTNNRINIALSTHQPSFTQRDSTQLTIETTDYDGNPVNASLSVLVMNKEQQGKMQDMRQHILSYYLLSSELKGTIENPGFYFSKTANRDNDIDALLLTQGWRKYQYNKPAGKIIYQPEQSLNLSGTVGGVFFRKKMQKSSRLTMMTFGPNQAFQTQPADSMGRFNFPLPDAYGDNLNVIIQSADKSGEKKDYTITLDKKSPPPIYFNQLKSIVQPDSIIYAFVEKNRERNKIAKANQIASQGLLLDEVILKSYRMTPERKKVADEYGKPDYIIEGQAIRDKEAKWSYGLYSVLLFNFPDKVRIYREEDGTLYARLFNNELTLVVIDGVPVFPEQYPLIPNIPPSEVSSFEIIDYATNFTSLYCRIFPENCLNAPAWGNVIAIYTYGKKGIFGANRAVGIMKTAVPVFSAPREFYAPRYPQLKPADWENPDLRALIHWQPTLTTDSLGKASTSFYNADNPGQVQVVVEAIADNGAIGYAELNYRVTKKN